MKVDIKKGYYLTRDGHRVFVFDIKDNGATFNVHGYIERFYRGKMRFNKWAIFDQKGKFGIFGKHGLDLMKFLGETLEA